MADLTPRTRSESFLNGEDLDPITRREHFYAGRENELPEGHQEPETREEWFIKKYREAGDVTVESLSITENGTYTAPSGKAYSPVSVNVPLPSNAYLLQTIEHESIATFADGTDNFVKALEVAIEPQQDLHGYDKPWVGGAGKNKFPLLLSSIKAQNPYGWSGNTQTLGNVTLVYETIGDAVTAIKATSNSDANLTISLEFSLPSGSYILSSDFEETVYQYDTLLSTSSTTIARGNSASPGQSFSLAETTTVTWNLRIIKTGTVTIKPMIRLASVQDSTFAPYSNICQISGHTEANIVISYMVLYNVKFKDGDNPLTVYGGKLDVVSGLLTLTDGFISSYNGETLPSTWISDRDVYAEGTTPTIGAEVCYKLATPQTIQLSPTIIKSLQGENNLFASTGEVIKLQYWGKEVS